MKRTIGFLIAAGFVAALGAAPASAIVYGQFDGNRHPYVGALVAEWREEGQKDLLCSGTLIVENDVFLTAAHCTEFLRSIDIGPDEVWVTFDPTFDENSPLIPGTYFSHPEYGHDQSDPKDLAVVLLERPHNATPARLPTLNLLSQMKADKTIDDQRYTAVGYGVIRESRKKGPQGILENEERRFATQTYNSLTKSWLKLSMNEATGDGGTCYGDSGGPHFLGDSNLIVSVTVTGDAVCKATDVTYRLDTQVARDFLDDFVAVP
ncbi:MAG: trypsin-like serine protease [Actinomycetota bacterium]